MKGLIEVIQGCGFLIAAFYLKKIKGVLKEGFYDN